MSEILNFAKHTKKRKETNKQPQGLQMQRGRRCNSEAASKAALAKSGGLEFFSSKRMTSILEISFMDMDSIIACDKYC